jgi:hypothetical protein
MCHTFIFALVNMHKKNLTQIRADQFHLPVEVYYCVLLKPSKIRYEYFYISIILLLKILKYFK